MEGGKGREGKGGEQRGGKHKIKPTKTKQRKAFPHVNYPDNLNQSQENEMQQLPIRLQGHDLCVI